MEREVDCQITAHVRFVFSSGASVNAWLIPVIRYSIFKILYPSIMQCSAKSLEKWGQMTHTVEKYGDIGNFPVVTYVILPFVRLKFVGTRAPSAKIIGDIPDFNVLNVPKTQPRHNPEFMHDKICIISQNSCLYEMYTVQKSCDIRAESRLAPSQWETSLQSNAVSHWLRVNLQTSLGVMVIWVCKLHTLYLQHKW